MNPPRRNQRRARSRPLLDPARRHDTDGTRFGAFVGFEEEARAGVDQFETHGHEFRQGEVAVRIVDTAPGVATADAIIIASAVFFMVTSKLQLTNDALAPHENQRRIRAMTIKFIQINGLKDYP